VENIENMDIILILIIGYLFTFISGTFIVRTSIKLISEKKVNEQKSKQGGDRPKRFMDTGLIVGLCENFIIITLILINEIQSLALIFSAKTIVRYKGISENPQYYLAGTMVNFSYSVFMAFIIMFFIK
jgi:hypothetical protein